MVRTLSIEGGVKGLTLSWTLWSAMSGERLYGDIRLALLCHNFSIIDPLTIII